MAYGARALGVRSHGDATLSALPRGTVIYPLPLVYGTGIGSEAVGVRGFGGGLTVLTVRTLVSAQPMWNGYREADLNVGVALTPTPDGFRESDINVGVGPVPGKDGFREADINLVNNDFIWGNEVMA